jgi:hypothetical protein
MRGRGLTRPPERYVPIERVLGPTSNLGRLNRNYRHQVRQRSQGREDIHVPLGGDRIEPMILSAAPSDLEAGSMTYSWEGHIACATEEDRLRSGLYATSEQSGEQQHLGGGVAAAGCDDHETAGRAGRAACTPNRTFWHWGRAYLKFALRA